jgi:hypothetical protein
VAADDRHEPLIGNCPTKIIEKTFRDRLELTRRTFAAGNGWHEPAICFSLDHEGRKISVRHKGTRRSAPARLLGSLAPGLAAGFVDGPLRGRCRAASANELLTALAQGARTAGIP